VYLFCTCGRCICVVVAVGVFVLSLRSVVVVAVGAFVLSSRSVYVCCRCGRYICVVVVSIEQMEGWQSIIAITLERFQVCQSSNMPGSLSRGSISWNCCSTICNILTTLHIASDNRTLLKRFQEIDPRDNEPGILED
jgi:hypothetical protein